MDTNTIHYLVERQDASGAAWARVTHCRSLTYAEVIATAGLRRGIGVAYRAIDSHTGVETPLCRTSQATAA